MTSEQTIFSMVIDDAEGINQIEYLQEGLEKVRATAEEVEKQAYKSASRAIHYAQIGWGLIQGMVRASGGAISMTQRLVISATLGAIQTLGPVLYTLITEGTISGNYFKVAGALLGLAQLGTAIAAYLAYEADAKENSRQLRGLNFMLSNMSLLLSSTQI
jgi:hypothetical protein